MDFRQKAALFVATGCYTGKAPIAPGTFGTMAGLPLCLLSARFNWQFSLIFAMSFTIFAIWVAHHAEKIIGEKDPGAIVIDEMAGILVTFVGLPFNTAFAATGFIIFRILDIAKPFPIRWLERRLSGGTGIVLDDVVAGIGSNLILRLIFNTG